MNTIKKSSCYEYQIYPVSDDIYLYGYLIMRPNTTEVICERDGCFATIADADEMARIHIDALESGETLEEHLKLLEDIKKCQSQNT